MVAEFHLTIQISPTSVYCLQTLTKYVAKAMYVLLTFPLTQAVCSEHIKITQNTLL